MSNTKIIPHRARVKSIAATTTKFLPRIAGTLPSWIASEQFANVFLALVDQKPELSKCTPSSLFGSLLTCAQMGLLPDGVTNQCHLVAYGTTCTFLIGYKGAKALAERHPDVAFIGIPQIVYANDPFERTMGLQPTLAHSPAEGDRGEMVGIYVVAKYTTGDYVYKYLSKAEVDKFRARSKCGTIWKSDYEAMAMKTVILRMASMLPQTTEMGRAQQLEGQADRGESQSHDFAAIEDIIDRPNLPAPPTDSQLREKLSNPPEPQTDAELENELADIDSKGGADANGK